MAWVRPRKTTLKSGKVTKTCQVCWYDAAGLEQHESYGTDYIGARAYKAKIEYEMAQGTFIEPKRGARTLGSWAEEWQGYHNVRKATRAKNRSFLDVHILPELGTMPLGRITERDYHRFVKALDDNGLAHQSIVSITNTLSAVLNSAVDQGLIAKSPRPTKLRLPGRPASKAEFMTLEEVARLIEAAPPRYQALIIAITFTGLRWSEAAGLTVGALDLPHRRLTVDRTFTDREFQDTKNHGSRRTIGITEGVTFALAEHLRIFRPDASPADLVFVGPQGAGLDDNRFRRRVWAPMVREAGLAEKAPTPHDLRHSHVSHLIGQDKGETFVMMRLGLTTKGMKAHYAHLFAEDEDAAMARLDEAARAARARTVSKRAAGGESPFGTRATSL